MANVRNPARERLQCGELALGIGLRQARTVDIAAAMKTCGFDWLFIETMVAACKKHGKWAGMGGVYSDDGLRHYIGMGVQMVLAGSDLGLLMGASQGRTKSLRALK